ncbi:hypothetical protein ACWEQP_32550 [Streptomyces sp. NPDC004044]
MQSEAMVFAALAEDFGPTSRWPALRSTPTGASNSSWEDVGTKLGGYLVEVGLAEPGDATPYDAADFRQQLAPGGPVAV